MDVAEAIQARYSCRAYQNRDVSDETLNRVFELVRLAPSARNFQEWRFVVVRNPETRAKLVSVACDQPFVGQAPVIIACCAETDEHIMRCGQLSYTIDVAIAIDHFTLAAVEEGLGTCWIGAFHEHRAKELLGIPQGVRVVQLLTVGYPADTPGFKSRHGLQDIVRYEHW